MAPFIQRHWFKLMMGLIIVLLAGAMVWTVSKKQESPKFKDFGVAADFELENMDGNKVSLQATNGKVRLVYFFYSYCPDICGPTTHMLSLIQDSLKEKGYFGDKTAMYSMTFDPVRDTADRLKKFSELYHADPNGWYFLRGDEAAMQDLAKQYGVGVIKDEQGNFSHNNIVILVDKEGKKRNYYNLSTLDTDYETIVQDMIRLSKQ